jgi:signal transduction histidine kinase
MSETLEKKLKEARLLERNSMYSDSAKQIISSLTHELRTPLSVIASNIDLLKKFNYSIDNKVVNETFYLCDEAIKSMTRFVEDVSLLNGFNKNEWKANCKELNIISFSEGLIQKLPDHYRNRIRVEGNFDMKVFCTDAYLLSMMLNHVIKNALQFSAEEVFLNVHCSKEELVVQVKDLGIGIPEDEIDQVFEPFYRGSNVKMMAGSGLGLAIVKRSMNLLKGTIEVNSVIDHGTTFNIKILKPWMPERF